ncbi:MAG: hypothetical protein A2X34_08945 [Elusimicrobia bacterium GWC2_51_8]|nr:MAG: hypothetical protein A2X33_01250 [Elusimicrobia bacterium GWA2_51_34]OGR58149.1 MAG: hypothetical protein A2X34_08945 [Elusimicrobia bacterium GWC2_51_8]OGR86426.1 MAG: hypothetical protein A2021_07425 [Elusimicrobia bacterium GWF2_52_66]HAF96154.1 hypothetical protein [Elusimicrobiota bacterium]HCE97764.1 hypothetical protein [Elusimicrobiota bacterium]
MTVARIRPTLPVKDILSFVFRIFARKGAAGQEKIVSQFETLFAARYGLPPGVCFSKARVAFYFLLKNIGLKSGGEVLISAVHVADFVNMIRLAGFKPVVVDLAPGAYTIDYDDLERKTTDKSALMLITHLSGYATDMDRILKISAHYNIPVIEDCSQAVSSQYGGRPLGTFGKAAIFSLSLLKPVCTLSGGMVLSHDNELLDRLRRETVKLAPPLKIPLIAEAVKNIIIRMAVSPVLFHWMTFPLMRLVMPLGDYFSKYQKTNKTVILRKSIPPDFLVKFIWQQAVIGLSQLATVENREKERTEYGIYLYDRLRAHPCISLPPTIKGSLNSFWLFPILCKDADKLKRFLAGYGIDSSKFLLSLLCAEEAFKEYSYECESAKYVKEHTLFIPMYSGLTRDQLDYTVQMVGEYRG